MLRRIQPEVGNWYENVEEETLFEVVTVEEDGSAVAIQYFDGELEEMEIETFWQLPLRSVEQPEDWAGPYEIDQEDRDDQDLPTLHETDQYFPFDDFESGGVSIYDDY